eukprot:CAMPEP_0201483436 /NCGR_PEP_ID=MMETSP0151_2-20130828/7647_1 /ASSEMBLY_ACC=CAM_ASM_000257 /TAXON_ID=200890 /ORGANISM="Paramoeba atlantica, Strain 621/1 / CCAP 1560/9" /LENGTH=141 /DNA_ID=CAMNT_0047866577 /DNA_START=63 /DNA_END=484 /DNA_ORIENTATION=+
MAFMQRCLLRPPQLTESELYSESLLSEPRNAAPPNMSTLPPANSSMWNGEEEKIPKYKCHYEWERKEELRIPTLALWSPFFEEGPGSFPHLYTSISPSQRTSSRGGLRSTTLDEKGMGRLAHVVPKSNTAPNKSLQQSHSS